MQTLSANQLEQFERDGYFVAKSLLDFDQDLQPVIDEYTASTTNCWMSPSRSSDPSSTQPRCSTCVSNPPEYLLPELGSSDLVKATPWHQDGGVVRPEADDTEMLTVWLPLTASGIEHGCIKLVPGSHRERLRQHCLLAEGGYEIPTRFFAEEDAIPVPMQAGDVLFMSRWTCHGSFANTSDQIRWSFDLRYSPVGQPTGREEFPGFVARSRSNPESELHDPEVWYAMWRDARDNLALRDDPTYNRWTESNPACA